MRIDEILGGPEPVFSIEFFPPKTREKVEELFETVEALKPFDPDYVSVTYGAGGATRDGTVEIATRIKQEHGLEAMAHLSCVGETREGLTEILDRFESARGRERPRPARRPAARRDRRSRRRMAGCPAPRSWPSSSRVATTSRSAAPAFPRCTRTRRTWRPISPT